MTCWPIVLATLVAAGVLLRTTISLYSYSGENNPPLYGDYEAQRHWQEITVNLPIRDWYENGTDNDLLYWGLDYPPLTAYHSYLVGKWAQRSNPSFVKLYESRGITNEHHKRFMRNTVLLADLIVYIPAMLYTCYIVRKKILGGNPTESDTLSMAVAILYPGQILIDNGHFQYNNVSLGLAALAISAILKSKNIIAALFFVMALNYKQMELYHALPFFFYLLQGCFRASQSTRLVDGLWNLTKLGLVVVGSFAIIWSPWMTSVQSAGQVLHRIFPVARGVFEDKVSNVWCIVNVFHKLKNYDNTIMAIVCMICTLVAVLPNGIHLLFRPSLTNFLLALVNSSLGFFLFSFQVHEKSILLVTLPILLIFPIHPFHCFWFLQIATFSMIPLLSKDGLILAYLSATLFYLILLKLFLSFQSYSSKTLPYLDVFNISTLLQSSKSKTASRLNTVQVYCFYGSLVGQAVLLYAFLWLSPPPHLPFLWPLLISAYSCGHFVLFFLYFNWQQFFGTSNVEPQVGFGYTVKTNKRKAK